MDPTVEPALRVTLLWLLFGGSHIALASHPLRTPLVERFGRWGFLALYYAVAALTFTALVHGFATLRMQGAAGLALGHGALGALLGTLNVVGFALVGAALLGYPRSAYAFHNVDANAPRGIETITRHAFFVGLAVLGVSHMLLAPRLVGVAFMGGMAVFTLLGSAHQDRKLLRERGAPYAAYLAATSTLPFAAVLAGRTPLRARELPYVGLAVGAGLGLLLRTVHESLFARGGLYVIALVVGGALIFAVEDYLRERRRGLRTPESVAS